MISAGKITHTNVLRQYNYVALVQIFHNFLGAFLVCITIPNKRQRNRLYINVYAETGLIYELINVNHNPLSVI